MMDGNLGGIGGRTPKRSHKLVIGAIVLLLVIVAIFVFTRMKSNSAANAPAAPQTVRVETAVVARGDVPVYADGLGTVQAFYTATVSTRVDGELQTLSFTEGQTVKQGDVLAQIDPRPFRAALDQAIAVKAKDAAQLANAQRDLERYVTLAPEEFTSKQTLETQRALVAQLVAQVDGDQASIDSAKTQLDYTTIRSPIQGRTGIRQIDPGNIVHAAASTGIVVVTQVQPISVIFTMPADELITVSKAMSAGPVTVTALSRDGKTNLGEGVVKLIDNQIDQTTGTIRLKASFPNKENKLWPGDFVNARVFVQTRHGVLTIPTVAIQRGPNGVFAYLVKPDGTLEMRALQTGEEAGNITIVEKGLEAGDRVTTSNQYRLQPGIKVQVIEPGAPPAAGKDGSKAGAKGEAKAPPPDSKAPQAAKDASETKDSGSTGK
jgi:membrane fusion protein, multidrug efflux system